MNPPADVLHAGQEQGTTAGAATLSAAPSPEAFFAAWLALQCETVPGALGGVVVLGAPDTGPFAPLAFWPGSRHAAERLAEVAERALAERQPAVADIAAAPDSTRTSQGVAFPLDVGGHLYGVVALEVSWRDDAGLHAVVQALRWGSGWAEAFLRRQAIDQREGTEERLASVLDLFASVLEEDRYEASARSLVTELALRLDCDRVSFGVVRGGHARIVAVSHSAQFAKRMNLINAIGAAMDEAIDQKAVIRYPVEPGDDIVVVRDHERLAVDHGSGSVLTIPVGGAGPFAGALTLERPQSRPFNPGEIELCQSVAAPAARVLALKQRDERSLAARLRDGGAEELRRIFGPRYAGRKLALGLVVLLAVFFSVATADYRVTAPATLEGAVRRSLAAPFDGYIATANLRAGDVAAAQAVLATLDDQDLRLERLKWASQYGQYLKQHQEAVANHDRAKTQIAQAMYEQALAQVRLLDEQLARAAIRAPFAGVVVKGDLSQSLGSAVKRGDVLFELTPLESYRVIVEVDEGEIAEVAAGQSGTLVLGAITDEAFPFTVRTVTSVTTAREGRNFFRVEAILDTANARLRPGMEGVAKVDIEPRKLIWIWGHRLLNWARLFVWTYLP